MQFARSIGRSFRAALANHRTILVVGALCLFQTLAPEWSPGLSQGRVEANYLDYPAGWNAGYQDGFAGRPSLPGTGHSPYYMAAYSIGYSAGVMDRNLQPPPPGPGYDAGWDAGYDDGFAGRSQDNNSAFGMEYRAGYSSGYSAGVMDRNLQPPPPPPAGTYDAGWDAGYSDAQAGNPAANNSTYSTVYQQGYYAGYNEGLEDEEPEPTPTGTAEEGWDAGYADGFDGLPAASNESRSVDYRMAYYAGYSAGEMDRDLQPPPPGGDYDSGWGDGYADGWDGLPADPDESLGNEYLSGYAAGYSDGVMDRDLQQ